MCRANRIDTDRPNKVAHCFVWADDVDNTAVMLHSLKYTNSEGVASVSGKSDDEDIEALSSRICMLRGEYDSVPIATGGCEQNASSKASALRAKAVLEQKITSVGCAEFVERWKMRLHALIAFIDMRKKRPCITSEDADEKRLAAWINTQQYNYAKNAQIMKDVAIREEWTRFVDSHATLFEDGATAWRRTFRQLQDFIEARGEQQRPSQHSKDADEKRLASWIGNQQNNYAKNANIMKDVAIRE
eukprot:2163486-Pleurochrysis_carterae.AAC.1